MKQRAHLASALVLGCVTVAVAGGCRAVDKTASPEPTAAGQAETAVTGVEGTVAEIAPAETPARPEPAAVSRPEPAPRSAPVTPRATPRADRPVAVSAPRSTPAPTQTTSRPAPAPTPARAETAAPAPRAPEPTAARPAPASQTASAPARPSSTGSDTWPSRESVPASSDSSWPSRDAGGTTSTAEALPNRAPVSEPSTPPAPVRRLETVTIPADAVLNVQLETSVSSVNAKVEDTVRARITRDVVAGGDVVIPAGSRLMGSVTLVDEGGRVRERSRLGIRFHTLVLANGTEVRLPTETIYREGESPAGRSAAKIGGAAVGGAILGAIMGGGKGAVIGAATGAGSGTGWAMAGERRPAELRSGQSVAVRVSDAVSTQLER